MNTPEILPAPAETMDELLSKLDMIHEVAKKWDNTEEGAQLDDIINYRVNELTDDIQRVHGTPEEWQTFSDKCDEIRAAVSKKLTEALDATFDLS